MYNLFVKVILNNNSKSTDQIYTYGVPNNLEENVEVGKRVKVNFSRKAHIIDALIISVGCECDIHHSRIKPILDIIDKEAIITENMIKLSFWIRDRYVCKYSDVVKLMIPSAIKYEHTIFVKLSNDAIDNHEIVKKEFFTTKELKIIDILKNKEEEFASLKKISGYQDLNKILKNLEEKSIIEIYDKENQTMKSAYEKAVYLTDSEKEIDDYDINKTKNQIKIIQYLKDLNNQCNYENNDLINNSSKNKIISVKEISKLLDVPVSAVNNLIKKNILSQTMILCQSQYVDNSLEKSSIILNEGQNVAYERVIQSSSKAFLLHGVTGSGKTEVYMSLIDYYQKNNKQSIMLVPEISLTTQTIERFRKKFGNKIAIFHSRLSKKEKYIQWQKVYRQEVDVIIGARSAIFAPIKNLGIIIVDEEQEESYRSSTSPKYDTVEVALKMAYIFDAKVVLGSATPSISSYYMAKKNQIEILELKHRAKKAIMPITNIVDMSYELDKGNNTLISEDLYKSIKLSLKNKEQVILFLNKRGYTGFVSCKKCGTVIKCDHCDVSMTYHIKEDMFKCHYCGRTKRSITKCPNCESDKIEQFGAGTQQVEQLVKKLFKNAIIDRMDMDTMTNKDKYENIYNDFKSGKIDILIGTQMLAKGFDFPNVTTVGVLSADVMLNLPFFNAIEKTFQLLTQVSGRAGRGDKVGRVYIQTYEPENFTINAAQKNDYELFFNEELRLRKEYAFPPFVNIINICLISRNEENVQRISQEKYEILKNMLEIYIEKKSVLLYRPIEHNIYKVNDEYRINLYMKVSNKDIGEIKKIIRKIYMEKDIENIKVSININTDTV